jgi:hypothetical protein
MNVKFDEDSLGFILCITADGGFFLGQINPEGGFTQNKHWGGSIPYKYMKEVCEKILAMPKRPMNLD